MRELEQRTGVNRETIRVFLRHGLIPEPKRPKPNVADYDEVHVRGILAVRKLQKERRLSLPDIKRALDGDVSVLNGNAGAFPHLDELIATRVGVDEHLIAITDLEKDYPQARHDAEVMHRLAVIQLVQQENGQAMLSRLDAQLVSLWGEMRRGGYSEELGFDPEICALHAHAAQQLAEQELDIFLSKLSGKTDENTAAEMAQTALTQMLSFFGLVRIRAVLQALR